jgi:hypothetical protein
LTAGRPAPATAPTWSTSGRGSPATCSLWIVRAVVRHLHRIDEYQRDLVLHGLAVGFGVAMVTAVTLGFLGIAGLSGQITGWIVCGAGMFGWIVGGQVAARR